MPEPINTLPSSSYPRIDTDDVDVARKGLAHLYGNATLVAPGHRFEWHVQMANLGPIGLARGAWSPGVHLEGTLNAYVLMSSAAGVAKASTRNLVADIVPGKAASIALPDVPLSWKAAGPATTTTMRISTHFLIEQFEALTGTVINQPIVFAAQVDTSIGAGARLERLCTLLVDDMASGTPLDHPIVMMGIYETIVRMLLTHQPHDVMHLLEKRSPPSSQTSVRLAEEYLDANADTPIGLTDLTSLTGVSGQSLESAKEDADDGAPIATRLQ